MRRSSERVSRGDGSETQRAEQHGVRLRAGRLRSERSMDARAAAQAAGTRAETHLPLHEGALDLGGAGGQPRALLSYVPHLQALDLRVELRWRQ